MTTTGFFRGVPLLALALALAQTPAAAQTGDASAISASASAHYEAAYKMTSLSIGGVLLSPEIKQLMRKQLLEEFAQNEDFQTLEHDYPGIANAVVDVVLPVSVKHTEQNTPALIERLAKLYAAEMTSEDIAVATAWFSSPAFSRLSATMESNLDLSEIIRGSLTDTNRQVSGEDLDNMERNSAARSSSDMALEDRAAMMRFSGTSAYAKLEALKPRSQMIETEWTNEEHSEQMAELDEAAISSIEAFTNLDLRK
ncbi:hypothetical protein [Parasphingorhabdus sp.]|uniref:hypothetical protein n=1 Tax=Parasphingorhabdus sp. TaxID=2709688 RepID=UPI003001CECB